MELREEDNEEEREADEEEEVEECMGNAEAGVG